MNYGFYLIALDGYLNHFHLWSYFGLQINKG